ncbi:Putative peptidoglycan binding domain protein [Nereida ignava]|uniref:Putative peptidoglycan binding domain protein n=1 Tax=Nereida ignava TaxID=282199 RepID=A0A0U1NKP7_9RHOB|nr:peptidoglycan-binding protein [Nereida ignava]CRK75268.1 Putative peptidoglycan binding domain protein [Nereida ignava]SFJ71661.1 Putative peptidoglycan binding domain-containing protein [Nereida ignava DSM 16309]
MKYLLSLTLIIWSSITFAQDRGPFDLTVYGSFLHTGEVPSALFFFNDIEQYDSFELRRALRDHAIKVVVLGSDGGSVFEGLSMAGILNDKSIATYVPELPGDMGCYSACAYMFFGGQVRLAKGNLAVHQAGSYGMKNDESKQIVSETQQATQFTVSEIIGFLNEFDTPPWVYEKMFRSREFYEFSDKEKAELSSRSSELGAVELSSIDNFIARFFDHLEKLKVKEKEMSANVSADQLTEQKPQIDKKIPKQLPPEKPKKFVPNLSISGIQKFLNAAGCSAGPADGKWGAKTKSAVIAFSRQHGLKIDMKNVLSDEFLIKIIDTSLKCRPEKHTDQGANSCISKASHASYCDDSIESDLRKFPKFSLLRVRCGREAGVYSLKLVGTTTSHGGYGFELRHKSGINVMKSKLSGIFLANGLYAKLRMKVYLGNTNRNLFNIKLKKRGSTYTGTTARGCEVAVSN